MPAGGVGDAGRASRGEATWGNLPPKYRDPVMDAHRQTPPEAYRKAIEDYLRRLAEGKK